MTAPTAPPSVAPPAEFGRLAKDAPDLHADVFAGPRFAHRAMVQAGYRPRMLSVRLDDPAAAARSLRTHMEPADLMELIYVLAEAAADVLREQEERGRS
ncbi:MAG: hypothetical protein ACREX8_09770 [Gammaproteobacteria bacterium]